MYLEHFQLHTAPFSEEVDPEVFFPEANRDTILQGLLQDCKRGKLFVKLVGAEGTGKTLMCKVLQKQITDEVEVVYIDLPAGSFDDVLQMVCVDLGLHVVDEQLDLVAVLKQQLQERKARGQSVLLMLDGAENIFLATLERLLRLLCELGELADFTLMLAGRPALDSNLEQLTVYCSGVDVQAGYHLGPMNQEETGHYLIYRLLAAGLSADKQEDVFTGEAVSKLYAKAEGNPRLTSIFAEEALQKSCSEKSFLVLLDHVDGEDNQAETTRGAAGILHAIKGRSRLYAILAGVLLFSFFIFFHFSGEEKVTVETVLQQETQSTATPPVQIEESLETAVESGQPEPVKGQPAAEPVVPQQEPSLSSSSPVSLEAVSKKKIPVAALQQGEQQVEGQELAQGSEKIKNGEQLFEERLRASAGWLAGAYRGEYTIQLMMLASEQAQENVQKILVQDEYFAVIDQLHILRKKTSPPTLFVFYGTFASMESARQARNQMPIFLRKHHPYALSIADALTKTED